MKYDRYVGTILLAALLFLARGADASDARTNVVRVACVGDSITLGVGVKDMKKDSYPAQMARMLGSRWEVLNFGVSGATMMNKGDIPYARRPEYKAALESKPDVVVIALGTNDSKPQNVERHPDDFLPSYRQMVARFREVNPKIKIFVCLPVPAFPENWGIRESVIGETIIPRIRQLALEENLFLIDLHSALDGRSEHFPDKIHPNEEGARLMARAVAAAISNDLTKGN